MILPPVGVLRAVLHLDVDDDEDGAEPEHTGTLFIDLPEGEPFEGDVVLYTLDEHRLRGMLAAARRGDVDEDILLALDAAALDTPSEG